MKRIRVCRKTTVLLAAVLLCLLAAGCDWNRLADVFDEEALLEKSKASIEAVNNGDYEKYLQDLDEVMRSYTGPEAFSRVCGYVESKGVFLSYRGTALTGARDDEADRDMAVVVIIGEYESGDVQYTVTFDTNLKIIGWWVK